jgi:hypothetical protein
MNEARILLCDFCSSPKDEHVTKLYALQNFLFPPLNMASCKMINSSDMLYNAAQSGFVSNLLTARVESVRLQRPTACGGKKQDS